MGLELIGWMKHQNYGHHQVFWNDIRAWAFPTSSKVDIYCNLHVCPSACPFYQCRRLSRRETESGLGPLADSAENAAAAEEATVLPLQGSFEVCFRC